MDAYFEELRKKIVNAVEQRGMGQSETAHLFGVSLSSVKRYLRKFRRGESLSPGKAPGKRLIIDQPTQRLLEEDLKVRPFVILSTEARSASIAPTSIHSSRRRRRVVAEHDSSAILP